MKLKDMFKNLFATQRSPYMSDIVFKDFYMNILFSGDSKERLMNSGKIYENHELIAEIPKKYCRDDNISICTVEDLDLYNVKCKYKIGDGVHTYRELPYAYGTIPLALKHSIYKCDFVDRIF